MPIIDLQSMEPYPGISFENTEVAFKHKTDSELKKAKFIFSSMSYPWLVKLGIKITPWAIRNKFPINGIIRKTIFSQFVGGETLEQTTVVADKLGQYKVQAILDYGVEGKEGEENFDLACDEFIRVINYAGSEPNAPFMSVKVTGFIRFAFLEKLHEFMKGQEGALMKRFRKTTDELQGDEKEEWQRILYRMMRICKTAAEKNVGVLVDAEETWIQDPVDALTMLMMETHNKQKCVVYNTLQHYRHDRIQFLKVSFFSSIEGIFQEF